MKDYFSKLPQSSYWLIAANLLPLFGVLLWGWSTFAIVFIYWCENVMLGIINLLKIFTCSPDIGLIPKRKAEQGEQERQFAELINRFQGSSGTLNAGHHAAKLFIMPFFTVHYGMFCYVHGVFVFALLGNEGMFGEGSGGDPFGLWDSSMQALREQHLIWAILALAGSHLVSFFTNYLGKGEYRRSTLQGLMMQPYGRVVVLHLAILLGAFATMALGSPVWLLAILVVGKTVLDLKFHIKEHKQSGSIAESTSGSVA